MSVSAFRLGRRSVGLLLFLAAAAPACGGDPPGEPSDDGGEVPSACAEPKGDPIVHQGGINASETWSADSLHVVEGIFQIAGGSTLTLEPCVQVRMNAAAGFDVRADGNAIVAAGKADSRVRIFADNPFAGWGNIRVFPPSSLSFAYTTIEDGGHEPANDMMRAVLDVYGDQYQPVQ